jgi:hypothetical protein
MPRGHLGGVRTLGLTPLRSGAHTPVTTPVTPLPFLVAWVEYSVCY